MPETYRDHSVSTYLSIQSANIRQLRRSPFSEHWDDKMKLTPHELDGILASVGLLMAEPYPHIKVYEEERELTMMLLVDVSGSRMFGTTDRLKKNIITEIAAVLAFSASQNNDKVGCIFFSDRIEKFIPPKKGRSHILAIIRELIGFRPQSSGTRLSEPVRFLTNVNKKRCTTFILSDFLDDAGDRTALDDALKIARGKHDLVGIRVYDPRETELPDVGIVELQDAESGRKVWVDTSSRAVREHYADAWQRRSAAIDETLRHNRIDTASISTDGDYVTELIKLFKHR